MAKKKKNVEVKEKKKSGFWKEFKEFAVKGNMFDMATGVIIGAVFKDLVTSFTDNIIMPVVNIFTGSIDFSQWKIRLPSLFGEKLDETGAVIHNYLNVGNFISSIISFVILALVIFMMVKGMNKLRERGKKEEAPPAPPAPTKEEVLLTEIRDILKKK